MLPGRKQEMYMFGCSREPAGAPLRWERCWGSMWSPRLITLLSALALAGGSAVNATQLPAMGPSTVDDHEPVLANANVTESSFETQSSPNTELNTENDEDSLEAEQSILIYVVPVALLVLLILLITFFVMHHKRKKSKQDELGSENVKSPIFEEDTPSVMEIEMEELDKWMNSMNKNGDCECLPTVREEEKESITNPRAAGEAK
ncbi:transmembrane protein 154 isoform X3 [Oenanthe melanoleuca]|uniref:transmembrane protein 154 isoform X3 n=1 Tax=Oenanthe melanoleuca TaxID=2939378 RepID=UPI0024C1228A|nr:transmembrane protein 154 isoform X3 [Oenanthe melanoleuca]